ncbi:putative RNA polymerase [Pseudomonas phage MR4]|uniref:Putative RNA polymerase n=1 Tax=Pseudomonas phage MR4 TaxID=2711171 RepID=A0A6M3T948_9CAUD|nr:putative RNA polymerase [Pseudomonas phage MR4]
MIHINELSIYRLRKLAKEKRWSGLGIAYRYVKFKKLSKLRPVIREIQVGETLVYAYQTLLVQPCGGTRAVTWVRSLFGNEYTAVEDFKGIRKCHATYRSGDKILVVTGWR